MFGREGEEWLKQKNTKKPLLGILTEPFFKWIWELLNLSINVSELKKGIAFVAQPLSQLHFRTVRPLPTSVIKGLSGRYRLWIFLAVYPAPYQRSFSIIHIKIRRLCDSCLTPQYIFVCPHRPPYYNFSSAKSTNWLSVVRNANQRILSL